MSLNQDPTFFFLTIHPKNKNPQMGLLIKCKTKPTQKR